MELDDFKTQLKDKLSSDHTGRSPEDIASLLTKKTQSVIGKLKKSLRFEIYSGIVINLLFGYLGLTSHYRTFNIYFSVFAFLSLGFIGLLFYLLKRTNQLSSTTLPVKNNLQTIVTIIEDFCKRYFQFTMGLLPVCFIFAFMLGYQEQEQIPQMDRLAKRLFSSQWKVVIFIVMYMGGLSFGVYYFTKWYLKKLYGNYVTQLKSCIAELLEV